MFHVSYTNCPAFSWGQLANSTTCNGKVEKLTNPFLKDEIVYLYSAISPWNF